jgi:hypothetical protein
VGVHDSITLCVSHILCRVLLALENVSVAAESNSVLLLGCMMKMFVLSELVAKFILIGVWNGRSIFLLVWKYIRWLIQVKFENRTLLIKWSVSSEAIKFINEIQTTWLHNRLLHRAAYACTNKSSAKNDAKRYLNLQSVGNWDALSSSNSMSNLPQSSWILLIRTLRICSVDWGKKWQFK